jgi:MFS family permease
MPRDSRPSLLSDRSFRGYWAGQTISAFGDAFAYVATPLLVLDATGSVAAMGGVSAAVAVTLLVSGLVAGPIVDRSDRRRLMIACDVGRLVVFGAIPILFWTRGPNLPALYVAVIIGSALGNLFSVAYVTATPDLVDRDRLTEANGRLQGSQGLAFVVGPILAGIVAARVGSVWAIAVDALTFGVSAVSLARIRLRREGRSVAAPGSVFDGIRFLQKEPTLRAVTIVFVLLSLVSSGTMAAGILDVTIYHLRHVILADDRTVGLTLGVSAIGAVVGALSATRLRRRFGFPVCFIGATFVQGVALLSMGTLGAVSLAIAAATWTAGMGARGVLTQTVRQELTPEALLGRVTAAFWTVAAVLAPIGAALVTRAADRFGSAAAFRGSGAVVLVIGGIAMALMLPVRDRAPSSPTSG